MNAKDWIFYVSFFLIALAFFVSAFTSLEPLQFDELCPKHVEVSSEQECYAIGGAWHAEIKEPVPKPGYCRNTAVCVDVIEEAQKDKIRDQTIFGISAILLVVFSIMWYYETKTSKK